ncbi:MAG: multidrug effflux MFS transporter [Gammaproteobacteria bacterium]|nr:multidrug effflux MFS transporter [Gammaproteobacteria bacterium]
MNRALIQLSETHYLKCVVILLPLMNFLSGVSTDLYAPSLPALASYFHVSVTVVKNSVTTTLLGFALGALIFGLLMDVYGRKKVIVLTVIAFTLVSFYAPFCRNIAEPAYAVEPTSSYILSSSAVSFRYRPLHIVFGGVNCIGRLLNYLLYGYCRG